MNAHCIPKESARLDDHTHVAKRDGFGLEKIRDNIVVVPTPNMFPRYEPCQSDERVGGP